MYLAEAEIAIAAEIGRGYAAKFGLGPNFADLGPLLGRDARGLSVLGAVFHPHHTTPSIMEFLPRILEHNIKAQAFHRGSHQSWHETSEKVFALKPKLWVCGVFMNYRETIATLVALSDNSAFSHSGITLIAETLGMVAGTERINGLEELLADRAREIILSVPRHYKIMMLE